MRGAGIVPCAHDERRHGGSGSAMDERGNDANVMER